MKRATQLTIAMVSALALAGCQISGHTVPTKQEGRKAAVASAARPSGAASVASLATDPTTQETRRRDDATTQKTQYGQLPLSFEANLGQTDPRVQFLARGRGYTLFLTQTETVFALRAAEIESVESVGSVSGKEHSSDLRAERTKRTQPTKQTVLRMRLEGANPSPIAHGLSSLPGIVNYFIGNDPKKWRTNIPTYKKVGYKDIYPGIDLAYYGNQGKLEYDLIVAPGADPNQIKLAFDGADLVEVDSYGDLVLTLSLPSPLEGEGQGEGGARSSTVRLRKPLVYQIGKNGHKELIAGNYVLRQSDTQATGNRLLAIGSESPSSELPIAHSPSPIATVRIQLASYDKSRPVVIDPILVYSTYLGGSLQEAVYSIKVDAAGNAYATGGTLSADFPTTPGAFQTTIRGDRDVFVTKLNPTGDTLVYSTYLGGSGENAEETGSGIAVDTAGNAFVTGVTPSTDFPTTAGAFQTTLNGDYDAFVAKLNPTGSTLLYSTLLGGSGGDSSFHINVDTIGNAHVTGTTDSTDFPTTPGAFQTPFGGSNNNTFVTKLDPTGSGLVYSAFLGGIIVQAFAVDSAGNAYVTGQTNSPDFPTTPGAFQTTHGGQADAVVTKLNPTGAAVYSTYLGGIGDDGPAGGGLAVDASGNAYVSGQTSSANFPTVNPVQSPFGGVADAFVTKLNPTGSALAYSTYLGGSFSDNAGRIVVDATGNAYVIGSTGSTNFPTTPGAFQTISGGSTEAFVAKLNPTGSTLVYSTFLGGTSPDFGSGDIVVDASGNAYVLGQTSSTDFPTTAGAFQTAFGGGSYDVFVTKLNPTGSALVYSTYLGGSFSDIATRIDVDASGNAYVSGTTDSTDFPTTVGAFRTTFSGSDDAFVAKISVNTPSGTNVSASAGNGVTVTFTGVVAPGETSAATSDTGPTPPAGFSLGTPPTYYDITTTATFAPPVDVCISYDPAQFGDPFNLRLFHFENDAWVDVTTSTDTTNNVICGRVSTLSLFVIAHPPGTPLTSIGPANIWVGLKNSDDVGIRFDLRAEVYRNSTQLVGTGEVGSVPGGSSGFNNARQNTIPLTPVGGPQFHSGDTVSIKLFVRNACTGSGKNSGRARLWFNDSAANSRFDATIGSPKTYFLRDAFVLATTPGPGPKEKIDVAAGAKCSPYKTFGTWTTTIP